VGYVPDRAGDKKPSLKVSSGSRERKRFTPSGFREHRPEILKDISGYVDDCYYWVASELHNTVWPGGVRIRRTCVASVDMTVHRSCGGAAQVRVARVVGEKV